MLPQACTNSLLIRINIQHFIINTTGVLGRSALRSSWEEFWLCWLQGCTDAHWPVCCFFMGFTENQQLTWDHSQAAFTWSHEKEITRISWKCRRLTSITELNWQWWVKKGALEIQRSGRLPAAATVFPRLPPAATSLIAAAKRGNRLHHCQWKDV